MTVLQPLYISQGRYTASIDRKLISSIVSRDSNGSILPGVIPPKSSMKVTNGTNTVSVSTGMCIISDGGGYSSPGAYICCVDSNPIVFTTNTNGNMTTNGTYHVFAQVDETTYTITNITATSGYVTYQFTGTNTWKVGETLLVNIPSGSNSGLSGVAQITAVTASTVTTATSVSVSSGTISDSNAVLSVPFAIRVNTTLPSSKALLLADVTVSGGSVSTPVDKRTFATLSGGTQIYSPTNGGSMSTTPGNLGYDLDENVLRVYDDNSNSPKPLYYNATGHHDNHSTDGSSIAIHHTLGNSANQAASGSHTHDGTDQGGVILSKYAFKLDDFSSSILNNASDVAVTVSGSSSSPTIIDQTTSVTVSKTTDILATSTCAFNVTGTSGYFYFFVRLTNSTGGTVYQTGGFAKGNYNSGYTSLTASFMFNNVTAGTYRVQAVGYRTASTVSPVADYVNTLITPIKAYS